jgi:hypothetical protein
MLFNMIHPTSIYVIRNRGSFGDCRPKIKAGESKRAFRVRTFENAEVKFGLKSEAKLNSPIY